MEDRPTTIARVAVSASGSPARCYHLTAEGMELGRLYLDVSPSAVYVDATGRRARLGWASLWRREYKMWRGGLERGSARLLPAESRVEIAFGGDDFDLRPIGADRRAWRLVNSAGEPVVTVEPAGSGPPGIAIHAPITGDLLALVYYIAMICRRMGAQFC